MCRTWRQSEPDRLGTACVNDPRDALDAIGKLPDTEIDIADAALQLARVDAPGADWQAARAHLSALAREAVAFARHEAAHDLEHQALSLASLISGRYGYAGDIEHYEDLDNVNLIRVIDRRRGMPVALGILWLHCAHAAGWGAYGIDFPGHFLVGLPAVAKPGRNSLPRQGSPRASGQQARGKPAGVGQGVPNPRLSGAGRQGSGQAVIDVFRGGAGLDAPQLRALIKRIEGEQAELRPGLLKPMSTRGVLLRLQNNIKLRRLRAGELDTALRCVEDMLRIAPDEVGLWREAGLINQRLDRVSAALGCFERFLDLVPSGDAASRVRATMDQLRARLN